MGAPIAAVLAIGGVLIGLAMPQIFEFIFSAPQMDLEVKEDCLRLTSYFPAEIPACQGIDACAREIESNFLKEVEESELSLPALASLKQFKGSLSIAWDNLNEAKSKLKLLNKACRTGNVAGLQEHANGLGFHLETAFQKFEPVFQAAKETAENEKLGLEEQGLDSLIDEEIYDSYLKLKASLKEDELRSTNNKHFTNWFWLANKKVDKATEKLQARSYGATPNAFSIAVWVGDHLSKFSDKLLELIPEQAAKIISGVPLPLSDLKAVFQRLDAIEQKKIIRDMQADFNAYAFFDALDDLSSTEQSMAAAFRDLIVEESKNKKALKEKIAGLKVEVNKLIIENQALLQQISSSAYAGFDENFLADLYRLIESSSVIRTQTYAINEIHSFKEKKLTELNSFQERFQTLKRDSAQDNISLGEETLKLKELHNNLEKLKSEIKYFTEIVTQELEGACDFLIGSIEAEIETESVSLKSEIAGLQFVLKRKIRAYQSLKGIEEKFPACRQTIEAFIRFKKAEEEVKPIVDEKARLENCLAELEKIIASHSNLSHFYPRWQNIAQAQDSQEKLFEASNECLKLQADVQNYFKFSLNAGELEEKFSKAKDYLEKAKQLGFTDSNLMAAANRLNTHFNEGTLRLDSVLRFEEIKTEVEEFYSQARESFLEALKKYLEKNAKITFNDLSLEAGQESLVDLTFSFLNPFNEVVNEQIDLELNPLKLSFNGLARFFDENISIKLTALSLGENIASVQEKIIPALTSETEEIIADASQAEVVKKIYFKTLPGAVIPRIKVSSELIEASISGIKIFSGKKRINDFMVKENGLIFWLAYPEDGQEIIVSYEIAGPLQISHQALEPKKIRENLIEYAFELKVENILPVALKNVFIKLPFKLKEENLKAATLMDQGKKIKIKENNFHEFGFQLKELLPGQTKQFTLTFQAENYSDYWQEIIAQAKTDLMLLTASQNKEIKSQALKASEKLEALLQEADFLNSEEINGLNELLQEIEDLKEEEKASNQFQEDYALEETFVQEKLSELRQQKALLESLGFNEEKEELEKVLEKAEEKITQAQARKKSRDYENAWRNLRAAKDELLSFEFKAPAEFLSHELKEIRSDFEEVLEKVAGIELSQEIEVLKENILLEQEKINALLADDRLVEASEALNVLKNLLTEFEKQVEAEIERQAKNYADQIAYFKELGSDPALKKIKELRLMLESFEKNHLESNYLLPFTEDELEEKEKTIKSLKDKSLEKKFTQFNKALEKKDYLKALALAEEFSEELEQKIKVSHQTKAALEEDLLQLKTDAKIKFEEAFKLSQNSSNENALKALETAKDKFNERDYLNSIKYSEAATAFLSLPEKKEPWQIPLAVYPLMAVLGLIAFFKLKFRKNDELLFPED